MAEVILSSVRQKSRRIETENSHSLQIDSLAGIPVLNLSDKSMFRLMLGTGK